MNNRVSNGIVGKTFRTLGFILLLASSVLILSELVLNTSNSVSAFAEPYAQMVDDFVSNLGFAVVEYALLGLILGFLFIIWAIRKGIVLRLLITALLVFVLAEAVANNSALFTGIALVQVSFLESAVSSVESYLNDLIAYSDYVVPGANLALAFFLWVLFANKKPKRLSVNLLRVGAIFLLLAVIAAGLPAMVSINFATASWYLIVEFVLYALAYVFFILGGVFGILGFSRG